MTVIALKCSPQRMAGGSEIGNPSQKSIVGHVVYAGTASAVAGADVRLRPKSYTMDTAMTGITDSPLQLKNTTTDTQGRFVLDSIDTGAYCIEIADGKSNGALIQCAVTSNDAPEKTLPDATVKPVTAIQGTIPAALLPPSGSFYVQVYGLDRIARAGSATGRFTIKDVPEGSFTLRFTSSSPDFSAKEVGGVTVESGSVKDLGDVRLFAYTPWAFSRKITLNTSASGAAVSTSVMRFPVLIRLTESIIDFSAAAPGGADLRFTKADSTPLPFEIAQWDGAGKRAEVWVNVDTVRGNDSAQYVVMYYGNASASNASKSSAVFDTGSGFIAVWHLDGACLDASGNNHDGINYGALDTTGIIGLSKKFSGKDSIKIAGLLGTPATVTLSAWAQLDSTPPGGGGEIVSIGDAALIRTDYALGGLGAIGSIHMSDDSVFYNVSSGQFLKQTGWHFMTFTVDRSTNSSTLYIDGKKVGFRTDLTAPINYSGVGQNTYIGKHGNGKTNFNFSGRIDEARVYRAPMSADYIKLCYMNQKADDALVMFR
jgi:hypothetical protein